METTDHLNPRREFLNKLAVGATILSIGSTLPLSTSAEPLAPATSEADKWFEKLKGRHKMVFDAPRPHKGFPFAWPKVFLVTNEKTGTPASECGVVVVLRHDAICYAFDTPMWEKYNFGEHFEADDPKTKARSKRNPFWKPAEGDFKIPGVGAVKIGINELQAEGVMFCVCEMAVVVNSAVIAEKMNLKAEDVKKDWMANLLPGIQPVPSGVWAIGRAQEKGCAYTFAG